MSANAEFSLKRWSLIAAVRSGDAPRASEALEKLCQVLPLSASAAKTGDKPGMTPGAVRVAISRLRIRNRARLVAEVAAGMDAQREAEVDEEIAALFRAVN